MISGLLFAVLTAAILTWLVATALWVRRNLRKVERHTHGNRRNQSESRPPAGPGSRGGFPDPRADSPLPTSPVLDASAPGAGAFFRRETRHRLPSMTR